MNSDFTINQEVVCQVTDYLAEYNSAKRRSMRVPIEDCPVYEMGEDVYSRMTQDLDRGRYNEVTPLEAWQEYKRSMEKSLSCSPELLQKLLSLHPELRCLIGDIDDCQQENADAPVQGEDPDATIFIEQFFQTDNDVPF